MASSIRPKQSRVGGFGVVIRSFGTMLRKFVDRTKFANALDVAFDKYVEELKAAAWDDDIWLKARPKIWWLIQMSR